MEKENMNFERFLKNVVRSKLGYWRFGLAHETPLYNFEWNLKVCWRENNDVLIDN